ncbi:MAG: hypothetical protein IPG84_18625 [Betaproteobacteria bacterium]|nr:hypothetical protein [Betaproteobacteria bacterium]
MPTRPQASLSIATTGGAYAGGDGYAVILACVGKNADGVPRVFTGSPRCSMQHDYSQGADLAAHLLAKTRSPIIFVPMPIVTAGALRMQRSTGTGTSIVTYSASTYGYLEEVDATLTVTTGGTVGAGSGPIFTLSLDGGRTTKTVRLGTASTYTIPHVGIVLNFGAGTMVAGDTLTFRFTAPKWDNAGLTAARTALAAQQKASRSWNVVGDLANSTEAGYVTTITNAYETTNKRFVYARTNVRDGGTPSMLAKSSGVKRWVKITAAETLTFAEVGATDDTITRSVGSFVDDGLAVGDVVTVAGTTLNNVTGRIKTLTATVLTFDATDLVAEVTAAGVGSIVASNGLIFAEVGGTGDTITRNAGSFVTEGFAAGDIVTITGTASNNVTTDALASVSATVLTLASTDLAAEEIGSHNVTITKVLSKAADVSLADIAFASVDAQKRIDLGYGRARVLSPITLWEFRRPASWHVAVREYQHALHVASWQNDLGPLDGVDLEDTNKQIVEYDERVDGGALAARFTCLTTSDNGPNGTYVAMALTRATDGDVLAYTHNMAVTNKFCSIVQAETTRMIGKTPVLNADGTATESELKLLEARINQALTEGLLSPGSEGQNASSATWVASRADDLRGTGKTLHGSGPLGLRGTITNVDTAVVVT